MRLLLMMIFLALTAPSSAAAATYVDQPYRLDDHNRLSTDVMINGQGPFSFLLDTTTSIGFLFNRTGVQLGLAQNPPTEGFTAYGFNTEMAAQPVTLHEVTISGLTYRDMRMGMLAVQNDVADGILGIDALKNYILVLDRDRMRIQLISSDDNAPRAWRDWTRVELEPQFLHEKVESTFWSTQTSFSGHKFTALVGLGAGVTIINWKAAEQLGIQQAAFNSLGPPDKRLRDILGDTAPAVNTFVDIRVGDQLFPHQRVLIANAPLFDISGLSDEPAALIGMGLFKNHSLAIDFPDRKLYVGPEVGNVQAGVDQRALSSQVER